MFNTADDFNRWTARAPQADEQVFQQACALQGQLTKPPGALGRLEDVACWLASWQGRLRPRVQAVDVTVFAGNHGVTARG
ncbi:MAG: nicotinate-nucleotide--dimethylbenzimidazole phosphoribosyltransferase, partial [Hyphomicrobiales bacterium]